MEIKEMNIFEKLSNITNEISNVNKNLTVGQGKNSYKAVGEADVLKAVKESRHEKFDGTPLKCRLFPCLFILYNFWN